MKKELRKAFFDEIRGRRGALESEKHPERTVFQEVLHPGALYEWTLTVGNFLIMNDVLTTGDMDMARAMIDDYAERFETIYPDR